jgi:PilZ domain
MCSILMQECLIVRRPISVAERRDWDRLPISIPFFVRGRKLTGEDFLEFATALNLSAGGVLLATKRYLDPGTQISLEIPIALVNKAQLPRSVSLLHATVLRCTPDRQYFLLGLQFEEPLIVSAVEARSEKVSHQD